jgi:WD repeat and SOF domain-containing protein 1
MAKNYKNLSEIVSGAFDGQIVMWNATERRAKYIINSNHNFVKGVCFSNTGEDFLSCGDDKKIALWSLSNLANTKQEEVNRNLNNINSNVHFEVNYKPTNIYNIDSSIENIDHSYNEKMFSTAGSVVALWNYERNTPIQTYNQCQDGYLRVKFNPVENHILLITGYDRTINLYDTRTNNPLKSVELKNKSSAACWNPQEPFNFTVGNEDSNCYTFDMRKLDKIKMIHKDHILAVLDLDYSPTGKEFVTGSFDKTVRIFDITDGKSREVYHTQRMQKVYSVLYSMDSRYVVSGSDDTNIRFWKANADDPIKLLNTREKDAINYRKKLVEKFKYVPEIKKIKRHKHLPKYILNKRNVLHIKKQSKYKKLHNIEMNSKVGTISHTPERLEKITKTEILKD